jgi:hypothetical protein
MLERVEADCVLRKQAWRARDSSPSEEEMVMWMATWLLRASSPGIIDTWSNPEYSPSFLYCRPL